MRKVAPLRRRALRRMVQATEPPGVLGLAPRSRRRLSRARGAVVIPLTAAGSPPRSVG